MLLEGKNVVYVGGFGGVGSKGVEAFLNKGVKSMLIFDWNPNYEMLQSFQETYKNCRIEYVYIDLTSHDTIGKAFKNAIKMVDQIDLVVNGAGIVLENNVYLVLQINLTGIMQSCLEAMEYMSKANGGSGGMILNITSTTGLKAYEVACVYAAAKYSVNNFTKALGKPSYYEQTGVSMVSVCPGLTENPSSKAKVAKYSSETLEEINEKPQSVKAFAANLTRVVELAGNGTTWVLEDDNICETQLQTASRK